MALGETLCPAVAQTTKIISGEIDGLLGSVTPLFTPANHNVSPSPSVPYTTLERKHTDVDTCPQQVQWVQFTMEKKSA